MRFALGCVACLLSMFTGGTSVAVTQSGNSHASQAAYPSAVTVATDPSSGVTVSVDADGTGLTAKDTSGRVLWQADALKEAGRPHEGLPVVRYISIKPDGKVSIVLGKHRYAEAELTTGRIKFLGED